MGSHSVTCYPAQVTDEQRCKEVVTLVMVMITAAAAL